MEFLKGMVLGIILGEFLLMMLLMLVYGGSKK